MVIAQSTASMPSRLLIDVTGRRESLADYQRRGGYAAASWLHSPEELRASVDASGLRGRGGSAFPTGRKWQAVAAEPRPRVLLANGAETEPASRKDRVLLTSRPHLVIEGALLAARAIGAQTCVFYLRAGGRDERASLESALQEAAALRLSMPRWRIVMAAAGYVAGEETAAVQRCNNKPGKPTFKPPWPFQHGVDGRPTLVQNVETLANIPAIARDGAAAFRSVGAADSPGAVLVTLSGAVRNPGIYEAPTGTPLYDIVYHLGGGTADGSPVQALLPGGYFAGWLSGAALRDGVTLNPESLRAHGASLGAGTITVVPDSACGLAQAVALLRFFARESIRQCGPCTFGTDAMAAILERVARGRGDADDLDRLRGYAELMLPRRGACGHLDGATNAARTALQVFEREIALHARGRTCRRPWRVLLPGTGG